MSAGTLAYRRRAPDVRDGHRLYGAAKFEVTCDGVIAGSRAAVRGGTPTRRPRSASPVSPYPGAHVCGALPTSAEPPRCGADDLEMSSELQGGSTGDTIAGTLTATDASHRRLLARRTRGHGGFRHDGRSGGRGRTARSAAGTAPRPSPPPASLRPVPARSWTWKLDPGCWEGAGTRPVCPAARPFGHAGRPVRAAGAELHGDPPAARDPASAHVLLRWADLRRRDLGPIRRRRA